MTRSTDSGTGVALTRTTGGIITHVDDHVRALLGWAPDDLVGQPSTAFIHTEDQPSAVACWMDMLVNPGVTSVWRGRYRRADGSWRWVETENHLEAGDELVHSMMRAATVERVSMEEELRARKQLMNRLSDALPVGVVQIDRTRNITFTNDRLHAIVGSPDAATIDALLADVVNDDRPVLDAAITAVLDHEQVDDIELRRAGNRVCQLSLRPLTDSDGNVSGAIGCISDVTERVELRHELEIRASIDGLTSTLNRSAALALLDITLARAGSGSGTAVVFIDLDHFKEVNDDLGHAAGDRLLQVAADRVRSAIRAIDHVGRLGGDEFLVICPSVDGVVTAQEIGVRVAAALDGPVDLGTGWCVLGASVGVAWTAGSDDADALIARADAEMYAAKRQRQA